MCHPNWWETGQSPLGLTVALSMMWEQQHFNSLSKSFSISWWFSYLLTLVGLWSMKNLYLATRNKVFGYAENHVGLVIFLNDQEFFLTDLSALITIVDAMPIAIGKMIGEILSTLWKLGFKIPHLLDIPSKEISPCEGWIKLALFLLFSQSKQ